MQPSSRGSPKESIKESITSLMLSQILQNAEEFGVPYGSRTRVAAVKGRCPRPLDERDAHGEVLEDRCKLFKLT